MRKALMLVVLVGALGWSPYVAHAQGTGVQFLNFEAPAHKPIAVVDVAGSDYLLVANATDNSVEVYDTTSQHNFLFRVPTGQRPVTIVARPTPSDTGGREIYVANWLSDSITVFTLETANPGPLQYQLIRTTLVGDEPVGIAFLPENPHDPLTLPGGVLHELVLVTFSAKAAWGAFAPGTLAPIASHLELLDLAASPVTSVRDPRSILFAPPPRNTTNPYNDQMWILNFRGGNDPEYDFDLWGSDNLINAASTQSANLPTHGGLGTTNFNMAFAPNGELWVVGIEARNKDLPSFVDSIGEPIHQAQVSNETGFAVSYLARHKNPASATVNSEVLDLNDSSQGTVSPPVQANRPITQPTDVVVYGSGDNPDWVFQVATVEGQTFEFETVPDVEPQPRPAPTRIFATGMSSDTLAAVEPRASGPGTWRVWRLDVSDPTNAFSLANTGGVMRGPRGLALKASGTANDPRDRLYVYNRLSNSVTIVNPNFTNPGAAVLGHFQLMGQIEPAHVIAGRKFMYSSDLSAGGNVSCATCHIDGNTDYLAWNLSDGNPVPDPNNPGNDTPLPGALGPNAAIKGPMVTQPLRGLVNFEVANDANQDFLYSNRPYHWRGDKGFLEQFNAAFVNLMGLPDVSTNPPNGAFHMGISAADMILYRDFVFSMHYPPNPLQPGTRESTGTMFDEDNPPQDPTQEAQQINTRTIGSGGQLGLKLFHILNTDGVACNICHSLPEGSNNLFTEAFFHTDSTILEAQLLETAQLKGMALKERRLRRWDGTQFVTIPAGAPAVSHEFGLIHTGENTATGSPGGPSIGPIANSINDFVAFFGVLTAAEQDAVSLYMREFDTGVAPLAGIAGSASVADFTANAAGISAAVLAFEQQAERANIGAAAHVRVNGTLHGLWYDVAQRLYIEETQTGVPPIGPLTPAQLLAQIDASAGASPSNLLVYHGTPLGSQRRVARIQGGLAAPLSGSAPQNVTLNPSPTMTANVNVPQMTLEWAERIIDPATGNALFDFFGPGTLNSASLALFELSLINNAPGGYGVTQLRHEAPRRFQVEGDGILDGAFLRIFPADTNDIASAPGAGQPPTTVPNVTSHPFNFLLPIYPARDVSDDSVVWETAVEMQPELLLFFMNGGLASPWAVTAITNPINGAFITGPNWTFQTTDLMVPTSTNFHYVQVENVTSTGVQVSPGSWQRITVTP